MRIIAVFVISVAAVLPASAVTAQTADQQPGVVGQLLACQAMPDPADRLACFEHGTQDLRDALAEKRIVVTETKALREAQRERFGLRGAPVQPALPALSEDDRGDMDEVDEIVGQVAAAQLDPEGQWLLRLADGAIWRQVGAKRPVFDPKPGSAIVIRKGTLGTYSAKIDGQRAIKIRRER